MINNKFAILYKNCLLVKGVKNSIICDLHLRRYLEIPFHYVTILEDFQTNSIDTVKGSYDEKSKKEIDQFLKYLKDKDYIFFTDSIEQWKELDMQWFPRSTITNAVIDLKEDHYFFKNPFKIIQSLKALNCRFVQFRFFHEKEIGFEDLSNFLVLLEQTHLFSFEVLIRYNTAIGLEKYKSLCAKFKKVNLVLFNFKEIIKTNKSRIQVIKNDIKNEKCCGIISKNLFEVNAKKFAESIKYNSCLNRKLSIDKNGNIKNCPSMKHSYGNIETHRIEQIIDDQDFRKIWNLNKDQISICKVCEFRYICTDCRAYVEDPLDINSKPLKCGYDPYTNKWEDWSKNPLKKKSIEYYRLK
ncbi:grasp-with-spasm system SPASM domain peptide maturase [Aquimarina gracilis]|uniref:Grasp-with-spasm system SPASM domain peptide maturase n=1 Tax=Aquimarina gracilis TaxID=874422 RepID=A0ABU6A2T2_9FLAO|nr:grasp-with-spasm system SPASM domain peptide maturase [Aquimarina gracilis]MEB3348382.1 grasp-with-spasm system SPASM domain peptide maturase [Aquimarina gracilis]